MADYHHGGGATNVAYGGTTVGVANSKSQPHTRSEALSYSSPHTYIADNFLRGGTGDNRHAAPTQNSYCQAVRQSDIQGNSVTRAHSQHLVQYAGQATQGQSHSPDAANSGPRGSTGYTRAHN